MEGPEYAAACMSVICGRSVCIPSSAEHKVADVGRREVPWGRKGVGGGGGCSLINSRFPLMIQFKLVLRCICDCGSALLLTPEQSCRFLTPPWDQLKKIIATNNIPPYLCQILHYINDRDFTSLIESLALYHSSSFGRMEKQTPLKATTHLFSAHIQTAKIGSSRLRQPSFSSKLGSHAQSILHPLQSRFWRVDKTHFLSVFFNEKQNRKDQCMQTLFSAGSLPAFLPWQLCGCKKGGGGYLKEERVGVDTASSVAGSLWWFGSN